MGRHTANAVLALLAVMGAGCAAQSGPAACVAVGSDTTLSLTGRLALRSFPGPPNFTSIASGDKDMRVFVLTLPAPICIRDSDGLTDPTERFDRVQLVAASVEIDRSLHVHANRRVTIAGPAWASDNAFHVAPLVVSVEQVRSD